MEDNNITAKSIRKALEDAGSISIETALGKDWLRPAYPGYEADIKRLEDAYAEEVRKKAEEDLKFYQRYFYKYLPVCLRD